MPGRNTKSAIDICEVNNKAYAENFSAQALKAPPALKLAIVACMDARLEIGRMLGIREGDAHVMRNAGGVVTEDVIRSLTVSQCVLGTREIMIIQHTDCGMLTPESEIKTAIERESGTWPKFPIMGFADLEASVKRSVARIEASPFLPHKEHIRGFLYDVETGTLREIR